MVRVTRLTAFCVFVGSILLLGIGVAVAGDDEAAQSPNQENKAVAYWLDRGEQYAFDLSEPQLIKVFPVLCDVMVKVVNDERIDHLLALIKDPKKQAGQALLVCQALAIAGKYDAAIRRAK